MATPQEQERADKESVANEITAATATDREQRIHTLIQQWKDSFLRQFQHAQTAHDLLSSLLVQQEIQLTLNEQQRRITRDERKAMLTNTRKAFYDKEQETQLRNWYHLFWWLYYGLAVMLSIGILIKLIPFYRTHPFSVRSLVSATLQLGLLWGYPFFVEWIWAWLYPKWNALCVWLKFVTGNPSSST